MGWIGWFFAVLIALYTASYGWWAWQQQHRPGAIGTWVLALLAVALPLVLLLR